MSMKRNEDESKKRDKKVTLGRAISNTTLSVEKIPMQKTSIFPKYQTTTPALMERWKLSRQKSNGSKDQDTIMDDVDEETSGDFTIGQADSPPFDDNMVFCESFDDVSGEELRVKIVKDQLRFDLLELMRSNSGNVRILEDMETGLVAVTALEDLFKNCTRLERNIGFLWAAFMKRRDYVETLLKCGADIDYCEPNEGFSALHLSAFSGCATSLKYLISKGANVNYALRNYTPLHSAAFGNSVATAQILINSGARTDIVGCNNDGSCGTPIHSAIKANSVECVQLLAKYCDDINSIEPTGKAAIHVAADLGHAQCLQVILDVEGIDVTVKTRDKSNTALHLAAEGGNSNCLAVLLARGAEADAINSRGQTALHLAARAHSLECVETLLKTGGCDPNVVDSDQRTPLHSAVGRAVMAYEIAEVLISWRADVNKQDKYGYSPLHIAALNELAQCVETLIFHGADVSMKTKGGITALGIIVRKTPASLTMFYNTLDKAISMHDPEDSNREVELKLDFRSILPPNGMGEISFLNTFIDEGQKEILEHPLCEAFLHLKWEKIRKYYIGRLFLCSLFVLCLSSYVLTALAHQCYNSGRKDEDLAQKKLQQQLADAEGIGTRITIMTNDVPASENNNTLCTNDNSTIGNFLRANPFIIEYQWFVLVFFTVMETFRKFYGIAGYPTWKQYFSQLENLVEWFVIGSVFAVSCVFARETYDWQNHIGAFAVLCSWTNLMVMVGQLPHLGSYVAMYTKVLQEFAKLFLAYICLLIGFTISFCVIFPSAKQFTNPLIGFINVLVMMTGEVDVDLLIAGDNSLLIVSAHIIYVIFLLLVTVVLMNLLVGIAVNDIQGLKKTAGLSKLVRQTQLINYIERAMFNHFLPRYVIKIVSLTALVSPSSYRVVLQVKPLNPREKRLPKEILMSAYELAKSRRPGGHTLSARTSSATNPYNSKSRGTYQRSQSVIKKYARQESEVEVLKSEVEESSFVLEKLRDEVKEMKEMLINNQTIIQNLMDALNKK